MELSKSLNNFWKAIVGVLYNKFLDFNINYALYRIKKKSDESVAMPL
jgi:hypothetical protein